MRSTVTQAISSSLSFLSSRFHILRRGWNRMQMLTILIVVAVLVVVVTLRLINTIHHAHSPQVEIAEQVLAEIEAGLHLYQRDNGRYPSNEQGLLALIIKPARAPVPEGWQTGGYLDRLPRDPWGNAYQYRLSPDGKTATVFSFGENGLEVGDDDPGVIRSGRY